jgi:ATP-dependent Clp protease ATP-binding subunit ClpC
MADRPYTTRARRVLELADAAAARHGHPYIGTEHMLIGLLEERTGPAAQLLNHLGVTTEAVQVAWRDVTGTEL